jgi:hypothetical protein
MIQSKLSDQEIDMLMTWATVGPENVVKYVNRLLYERSLKDDGCFFPIAYRKLNGCFAKECMGKIISFIEELDKRHDKSTVKKTLKYIRRLCDRPESAKLQ